MRYILCAGAVLALSAAIWTQLDRPVLASDKSDENSIAVVDECDPRDPGWTPTGGCLLKKGEGDVSVAEFGQFLFSPLGPGILIGHPGWRNQPSYLRLEAGNTVHVANKGGRTHTFTEVAQFGGGRIPPLNGALSPAANCLVPGTDLAPGDRVQVKGLQPGIHRFQCCIHPWMRAAIRVTASDDKD